MGGLAAFGTLLKMGDGGGPETFTSIASVADITGPGLALDTAEVTAHDSPGAWKEHVATLLDAGEVTFDINYTPAAATHGGTTGVLSKLKNKTKTNFKLIFPDAGATEWDFAAFVIKMEPKAPHDNKLSAGLSLKITGQPTLN